MGSNFLKMYKKYYYVPQSIIYIQSQSVYLLASLSLAVTIISPAGYFPTVDINKRNLVSAYLQATMYTKCTNSIPILSPAKNNNCTIFQLSEYQCVCSMVTGCVLP